MNKPASPDQTIMAEDVLPCVKILVIGNGSVGKSSMIRRFCKGAYNENYKKTIGVEYLEKEVEIDGYGDVRLMLWDTAGQEEFDEITREYYKDTDAVVLAFSTDDRPSFETVKSWCSKIKTICADVSMVLVQNKIDLIQQAAVSSQEAEALARDLRMRLFRVSVKESLNVEEVFTYLAQKQLEKEREKRQMAAAAAKDVSDDDIKSRPQSGRFKDSKNTSDRRVTSARPPHMIGKKDNCIIS
ncbi:small GTP-binding protein domain [Spizellomyces punctatus DAOM BR117]|uniref:Small GTP-binding protein domain n=1 Tax=Spizellomyces punctatus (strain DAOM BR117) TaxID=645134 RepID=A0A0L0HSL1_SPIPD|nr:small GTP-binding protein domain [Spizellomyces punctatus DAOM BR117]KND03859.1 small GTP-binding protein domain [Spizellomyces punctatus DAOM BR117]|eukprot:XP_016611898.1 small GTP-binding protein domain [Spizellomyces punctatus DAOM BR117]